jgi:biotin-[acetyl-CoA-carboxylase] ligase BirA-like protein
MLIYSDDPEKFGGFFPSGVEWKKTGVGDISKTDSRLWEALGCPSDMWSLRFKGQTRSNFWSRIVMIADAPWSQFDALQTLFRPEDDLPGPVACLALIGQGFHGQRGRAWKAESGNLHLSFCLQPFLPVHVLVPALTMLPAVATVAAIRQATKDEIRPGIKWVNDIFIKESKVSGVLTATQIKNQTVQSCVLGIGVNVTRAPVLPPTPFVPQVGCLADHCSTGESVEMFDLFWIILEELGDCYQQLIADGDAEIYHRYLDASIIIGRKVQIWPETETLSDPSQPLPSVVAEGIVESIAPDLSLKLDTLTEPISHGRLSLVPNGVRIRP